MKINTLLWWSFYVIFSSQNCNRIIGILSTIWCSNKYVTWSRGMSRMSGILILSYRLKEVTNSYVFHCFELHRIVCISSTRCPIEIGFESKCSNSNTQVIYIEKSKLNIADMWFIPLDRVTYVEFCHPSKLFTEIILNNTLTWKHKQWNVIINFKTFWQQNTMKFTGDFFHESFWKLSMQMIIHALFAIYWR